jgi:hypothetical protein
VHVTIEIGHLEASRGAMMFHSTASGRFLTADLEEVREMVDAAKAGAFDGLFTDPPRHHSASAAAPSPVE